MADHRGPDMVQVGLKKASIRFRNPQHILVQMCIRDRAMDRTI